MVAAATASGFGGNPNPYPGLEMIYLARERPWSRRSYRRAIDPKGRNPMPRKHLFPLVVLLVAALVAGLLALGRAVELGEPADASTGGQPSIAFRLAKLDKAEKSLRSQLADLQHAPLGNTRTVYERPAAPAADAAEEHDDDYGDDHEDGHEDGHDENDHHADEGRDD